MTDPTSGQFFLYAVLTQSRRQTTKINLIKWLILIEAREYVSNLASFWVLVRLQALSTDLFHHALHR
jgi:hypothetical protein